MSVSLQETRFAQQPVTVKKMCHHTDTCPALADSQQANVDYVLVVGKKPSEAQRQEFQSLGLKIAEDEQPVVLDKKVFWQYVQAKIKALMSPESLEKPAERLALTA